MKKTVNSKKEKYAETESEVKVPVRIYPNGVADTLGGPFLNLFT